MRETKSFLTEVSQQVAKTMTEVAEQLGSMVQIPQGIVRPSTEQQKAALGSLSKEDLNTLRGDFGDKMIDEFIERIGG